MSSSAPLSESADGIDGRFGPEAGHAFPISPQRPSTMEPDRLLRRYYAIPRGVDMRIRPRVLARKLMGHAAIGAGMGGALALWILLRELDLYRMTLDGSAPEATGLIISASLVSLLAVGAGISGFVFMLFEDEV
jgi:hypothetical protein